MDDATKQKVDGMWGRLGIQLGERGPGSGKR
jgi:hypothetical protein